MSLACCLSTDPKILILDEPLAGIHPALAAEIISLLRRLREEGKGVIFVEHNLEAVRKLADHVIVMGNGRIVAEGPPEDVLERREVLEAYLE